tara:strand:+ start:76 stop:324 length:249 start_codon:yes stop_codon:yes gene_type:complete
MTRGRSYGVGPFLNALQENTPAIPWLYTQDLKCFVSRGTALPSTVRHRSIAQNAGCTMAIHAYCTKPKTLIFYNVLIYKDIL